MLNKKIFFLLWLVVNIHKNTWIDPVYVPTSRPYALFNRHMVLVNQHDLRLVMIGDDNDIQKPM